MVEKPREERLLPLTPAEDTRWKKKPKNINNGETFVSYQLFLPGSSLWCGTCWRALRTSSSGGGGTTIPPRRRWGCLCSTSAASTAASTPGGEACGRCW